MTIVLDPWQNIVDLQMKVEHADFVVLYSKLEPAFACLVGYGLVTKPPYTQLTGTVHPNSVGDWPLAITPGGSGNRSFPALGNGNADPLPTLLPTLEQLEAVYLWHVGRAHSWGIGDQLIVNIKKLKADHPDLDEFEVQMASHTWKPHLNGDGAELPKPEGWNTDIDLLHWVGIRAWNGAGGTFDFGSLGVEERDPFGDLITDGENDTIARYSGGQSVLAANFEQAAATAPISIWGDALETAEGSGWRVPLKRPKKSILFGYRISTS